MLDNVKATIAVTVFEKTNEITLLLCVTGILMSIGFLFGDYSNNNYVAINTLASSWVWSILFLIYGGTKGLSKFHTVPYILGVANSVFGLWLWSYIFLSFVLFDPVPMAATELLLVIPIVAEVWALTSLIYHNGGTWT